MRSGLACGERVRLAPVALPFRLTLKDFFKFQSRLRSSRSSATLLGSAGLGVLEALALVEPHLARVVAVGLEELPESLVLKRDGVLADVGQAKDGQGGRDDAQR